MTEPDAAATTVLDVLVLGGGLVGASACCALSGRGLALGLVEAQAPVAPGAGPPTFDERNLALAEASLRALAALGVAAHFPRPPEPIRHITVTRAGDFGAVRLDPAEHGREAFGGVVIARALGEALEARLRALPDLARFAPARFTATRLGADGLREVDVDTADGPRTLRARLVVAADGTQSPARAALGIDADVHDYGQVLFVCSAAPARAHAGRAFERFTATGPVALLPRPDGHYGAILGVAADEAGAVAALDDAAYLALLQERAGWRAGRLLRVGPRAHYPMRRVLARALVAPRAAVLGNAAQTIHPIGAQGFNLGLRDALTLAEGLLDARAAEPSADPGAPALLAAYAAARAEDRAATLAFSDGLARATATPGLPMHLLRSLGLIALSSSAALRAPLALGAMGYRGVVPRLARGSAA